MSSSASSTTTKDFAVNANITTSDLVLAARRVEQVRRETKQLRRETKQLKREAEQLRHESQALAVQREELKQVKQKTHPIRGKIEAIKRRKALYTLIAGATIVSVGVWCLVG
ncbi:hypothetical protein LTR56_022515 [Elasticomyces elasticus]|nr:hypothetical protein LTR56_022515 [Elasticomyces elasticus]KAK5749423.1 hypothetical protein LTS12_020533 [Elasticomyces elasticus]